MFSFTTCIFYAVLSAMVSLDRVSLKKRVIDAPEILTVIEKIPNLKSFLNSLYDCNYDQFFEVSHQKTCSGHVFCRLCNRFRHRSNRTCISILISDITFAKCDWWLTHRSIPSFFSKFFLLSSVSGILQKRDDEIHGGCIFSQREVSGSRGFRFHRCRKIERQSRQSSWNHRKHTVTKRIVFFDRYVSVQSGFKKCVISTDDQTRRRSFESYPKAFENHRF